MVEHDIEFQNTDEIVATPVQTFSGSMLAVN
jgi:hypothetical protein